MNIFLISQESARRHESQLVAYLSKMPFQASSLVPVVIIDECSWPVPQDSASPDIRTFLLDDFLHERSGVYNGELVIDGNVLGTKLGVATEDWLIVDFGLPESSVALDFIDKLATFTFLSQALREKRIVLLMPRLYLGYMGRKVNGRFNSIPATFGTDESERRHRLYLLSTMMEKVYMGSPFIAWGLSKVRQVMRLFYERVVRVGDRKLPGKER